MTVAIAVPRPDMDETLDQFLARIGAGDDTVIRLTFGDGQVVEVRGANLDFALMACDFHAGRTDAEYTAFPDDEPFAYRIGELATVEVVVPDPTREIARLVAETDDLVLASVQVDELRERSIRDTDEARTGGVRVACRYCDGEFYRPAAESDKRAVCHLCRYKEGG